MGRGDWRGLPYPVVRRTAVDGLGQNVMARMEAPGQRGQPCTACDELSCLPHLVVRQGIAHRARVPGERTGAVNALVGRATVQGLREDPVANVEATPQGRGPDAALPRETQAADLGVREGSGGGQGESEHTTLLIKLSEEGAGSHCGH